jgi:hypothetical protein
MCLRVIDIVEPEILLVVIVAAYLVFLLHLSRA